MPSTATLCRGADLRPARFRPLSALRGAGGRFCGPAAVYGLLRASGQRFPAGSGRRSWTWRAASSRSSSAAGPREPWARTSRTSTTPKASSTTASPSTAEQGPGQPRPGLLPGMDAHAREPPETAKNRPGTGPPAGLVKRPRTLRQTPQNRLDSLDSLYIRNIFSHPPVNF